MSNQAREKRNISGNPSTTVPTISDPFASPSLRVWISTFWKDLVVMTCMGAVALGVHLAPPVPSRTFPITFSDGEVVMPQFAYEPRRQIIPVWAAVLLASLVPIFFFALAQFRVKSLVDFVVATFGVMQALITSSVFQVVIKCLIGGLRPHFLAACKPVVPYCPVYMRRSNLLGLAWLGQGSRRSCLIGRCVRVRNLLSMMDSRGFLVVILLRYSLDSSSFRYTSTRNSKSSQTIDLRRCLGLYD